MRCTRIWRLRILTGRRGRSHERPHRQRAEMGELVRELLAQLRTTQMLFKMALLSTTVEIARQAKPILEQTDALIKRAEKVQP